MEVQARPPFGPYGLRTVGGVDPGKRFDKREDNPEDIREFLATRHARLTRLRQGCRPGAIGGCRGCAERRSRSSPA